MAHRVESRRWRAKQGLFVSPTRTSGSDMQTVISKEKELESCIALYGAYKTLCVNSSTARSAFHQVLLAASGKFTTFFVISEQWLSKSCACRRSWSAAPRSVLDSKIRSPFRIGHRKGCAGSHRIDKTTSCRGREGLNSITNLPRCPQGVGVFNS